MRSVCILLIIFCPLLTLSCSSSDDDNSGSGPYSYTITDPDFSETNPKYIMAIYSKNNLQSDISVFTAQDLTNGNSITISGLEGATPYDIFIWIDSNGNSSYGDDMKGFVILFGEINTDVENEVSFSNFVNKQINLSNGPASREVRCFWLIAGTLDLDVDESVRDLLGGTEEERNTVTTMVGSVTGTLNGSGVLLTSTGTNDFPVPANTSIGSSGLEYDCYCIVDFDNSNSRNPGDYDGEQYYITADAESEDISLSPIF